MRVLKNPMTPLAAVLPACSPELREPSAWTLSTT